jgi:hypothetical protein
MLPLANVRELVTQQPVSQADVRVHDDCTAQCHCGGRAGVSREAPADERHEAAGPYDDLVRRARHRCDLAPEQTSQHDRPPRAPADVPVISIITEKPRPAWC